MVDRRIEITEVDGAQHAELRSLLAEFHEWLADHAPVAYRPAAGLEEDVRSQAREPESWAWVAGVDGFPAGCVLLYGQTDEIAEFRRLWVRPRYRGEGIGRALTRTVVRAAGSHGYETLGLTTPPWSDAAQALYESMGFERTAPYPETRLAERHHDDAIFMQRSLADGRDGTTDA